MTAPHPPAPYSSWLDYAVSNCWWYDQRAVASAELDGLRAAAKPNAELRRRCDQAEAAVAETVQKWREAGGPCGGSFGRALLACEVERLQKKMDDTAVLVRELNKALIAAMVVVWSDANTSKKVEAMMQDKNIPQDLCSRTDAWLAEQEQKP